MEPHRLKDLLISQKSKDIYKKYETAVKKGDLEEVRKLIEVGEKLITLDFNETVMHVCVHPPAHETDAAIMELLIKAGGNPNAVNRKKETPLHYCGKYDRADICKVLLEYGANIGAIDKDKHTPYSRAQEKKAEAVCTLLEIEEKKRKESKPNWEKVEAAKQFFSLRRGTFATFMKKYKSEKQDTKDGTLGEDENEDGNINGNGNGHENEQTADQSDTKSSSTTATTTTPAEIQKEPKTVDSAENNKSVETTTTPPPEQNEIQHNKKEEQPPVVQEMLKVEEKLIPVAESDPVEQKPESVSPPIEEPKTEEPQQIKLPEEPINTVNS